MDPSNSLTIQSNPSPDLVGELQARWLDALQLRAKALALSPATMTAYRNGARRFLAWCNSNQVQLVTGETILQWQADLLAQGCKPGTVTTWLAGLRSLFSWAVGNRWITIDPTQGVKGPKRAGTSRRHLRDLLTDAEMRRVLAQPDTQTTQGKRDAAILAIFAHTAIRTIEIQRAELGDLRTEGGRRVLALQGKGKTEKDEITVIPPKAEGQIIGGYIFHI